MRNLTISQKKIIKTWILSQVNSNDSWERSSSVFKGGKHNLDTEDLPSELYAKIEAINDTEILCQEIDRYMGDVCNEIIHK